MSVLRAILGRFARFLVRIARTLDPALATEPYWVMPERMAALRQRYPGAPEHWLEALARRTSIGEPAAPSGPPAVPAPAIETPPPQAPSRPRNSLRNLLRVRDRPGVAFPRPNAGSKARPGGPRIVTAAPSIPPPAAAPQIHTPARPGLKFSTASVRNQIANLLRVARPGRRSAMLRFDANQAAPRETPEAPETPPITRREHQAVFPDSERRPMHRPDMVDERDDRAVTAQAELRWPARAERASIDPVWPSGARAATRTEPTFRTRDPRWPDLLPAAVESGPAPAPSLDEAILLAEQFGGTWSG